MDPPYAKEKRKRGDRDDGCHDSNEPGSKFINVIEKTHLSAHFAA